MQTEIVQDDWSSEDLRRELLIWANIELKRSQFYLWLKHAYIKPQQPNVYTDSDRAKLLRFAHLMQRYRSLKLASKKLYESL
ncbi:MAG: hypothetical protein KME15_20115 [Drouetiella hepatica Uher 2000/2452]|jgi:hypothetical protein|uniref:Uncharacterized protein n=1 Tax=Drouetiella hepatica Uher 2000/2452 TaxID=904376 RepID=A0A951QDZ9_9CYAN|nr:hypothetical protein [Drouetiella hepatica Uher 2000/2452]